MVRFSIAVIFLCGWVAVADTWRSSLYPEDWYPGMKDSSGLFLHDFSYAGYHRGEKPIPTTPPGKIYDVTAAPYFADSSGSSNTTAAIQQAINDAGDAGGGIVYLPVGTYNVSPEGTNSYSLRVWNDGVVIRGAGTNETFLLNTDPFMRRKSVVLFQPKEGGWFDSLPETTIEAEEDFVAPSLQIRLKHLNGLSVGDIIILRSDLTRENCYELGMGEMWYDLPHFAFCRTITALDPESLQITLDVPTRYLQKKRDRARIYKVAPHLRECGIEDLSMGTVLNKGPKMWPGTFNETGTGAYEVNRCRLIRFIHAENGWVQRVNTFRHKDNWKDCHMVSNGIELDKSRFITVRDCRMAKPQYRGGGGNGYGYTLRGSECLVISNVAYQCRHNYDFKDATATGNAIVRCKGIEGLLRSDFHKRMSVANLFDSMELDNDALAGHFRPYTQIWHGQTTSESVFWNTHRDGAGKVKDSQGELSYAAVYSSQYGNGYVIGTSGEYPDVVCTTNHHTGPVDFVEGVGAGRYLEPQSLYFDQLSRRLGANTMKGFNCE